MEQQHKARKITRQDRQFESNGLSPDDFNVCRRDTSDSLFNYSSRDVEKENTISLADYKGNVTLVVNVATY